MINDEHDLNDADDCCDDCVPGLRAWLAGEFRRVFFGDCRLLVLGLPALLVGTAVGLFAFNLALTPKLKRLAPYFKGASIGTERGQYNLALLCTERLMQELDSEPGPRYDHAMILEASGDPAGARSLLSQLAPLDRTGYPPAQLALARLLMAGGLDPQTRSAVERHLEHALNDAKIADEARILLGRIYTATGRNQQAEPYLRSAVHRYPALRLALARMARERGDRAAAEADLDHAIQTFSARVDANVDDVEARLLWARAVLARSDFTSAAAIIEKGLARADDPRYHGDLARIYALWGRSRADEGSSTAGERLALLERGLQHDPNNQALLDELARIIEVGGTDVGRIRSVMQARIVDGKATSATHFVLGLDAFSRGNADLARLHWEQAFRLEPNAATVANNLAWTLAHSNCPDLIRALELANRAVEQQPRQPRFRGTRACVLLKLKRWPEALTDLEASLASDPDSIQTHLDLADVYEKLGSTELSSQHRDRAAVLKQAASHRPATNQRTDLTSRG